MKTIMLVDCSTSMDLLVLGTTRRIDILRSVMSKLPRIPMIAFGPPPTPFFIEEVPEPAGGTPMHQALAMAINKGCEAMIVVSDGEPDSSTACFTAVANFHGPINTVFIGVPEGSGLEFMKKLARNGGRFFNNKFENPAHLLENLRNMMNAPKVIMLGDGK